MSTVTAILFGRMCWANALVRFELSSNNWRFSDWTQCYPLNFCEPYQKLHKFFAIFKLWSCKNWWNVIETQNAVKAGKHKKIPWKLRHTGIITHMLQKGESP